MINTDISPNADIIDVRDVIERVEELRAEWTEATEGEDPDDYMLSGDDWAVGLGEEGAAELVALLELLAELKGNGRDEQWRGDWYLITLVRDDYLEDYARELAIDCASSREESELLSGNASGHWPMQYLTVDWEAAADALRQDYSSVEYDGVTYWYR